MNVLNMLEVRELTALLDKRAPTLADIELMQRYLRRLEQKWDWDTQQEEQGA